MQMPYLIEVKIPWIYVFTDKNTEQIQIFNSVLINFID